jgi:hypothetical protein
MGWREAWRLGDAAFAELSFQAVYAFRQGNLVPTGSARSLVPRARSRVAQSKAIVAAVLSLLAIGVAELVRPGSGIAATIFPSDTSPAILDTGLLTGLLTLDAAFLWWTGLQVLPTLLSSAVLPVLEPLPIDRRTFRRAAAFVYLRLFDAPVAAILVVTPLALGLALGPAAAVAVIPGVVAAVAFSMALSLLTGRFFVRRIQGARGGGGGSAVRWILLFLWLVPSFTILGFVTAGGQFLKTLTDVSGGGSEIARALLFGSYPVPFALLTGIVAHGTAGTGVDPRTAVVVGAAIVGYASLAVWAFLWLFREVGELGHLPFAAPAPAPSVALTIRPQRAPWAVLSKDLRIASRTPGYAFLLLLPILDALALGLITVADAPRASAAVGLALGAVTAAALLATFFGPAFFSIEVLAQSYARTLPLADRSIVIGKATLIATIYLAASLVVLALASARVFAPLLFGAFVLAELPAVLAAALVELGWLFRRARTKGFPIANLYSGGWIAFLIAIPGLLLAGAPLVTYRLVGLPGMALLSVAELAVVAPFVLGGRPT